MWGQSVQLKTLKSIYTASLQVTDHTAFRSKSNDCLPLNQHTRGNVSEWSDMSICGVDCCFSKLAE